MFLVNTLSDEELWRLVEEIIPLLHDIRSGKIFSERFQDFQSGPSRRDLMFNAGMEWFTEEQHHQVLSILMKEFEPQKKKIDEDLMFLV